MYTSCNKVFLLFTKTWLKAGAKSIPPGTSAMTLINAICGAVLLAITVVGIVISRIGEVCVCA